jgi:hypothetical protein
VGGEGVPTPNSPRWGGCGGSRGGTPLKTPFLGLKTTVFGPFFGFFGGGGGVGGGVGGVVFGGGVQGAMGAFSSEGTEKYIV